MSGGTHALGSDVGDKLLALHASLDAAGIEHSFGGALALAYAVPEPRATRDIDVNIAAPAADVDRVLAALPRGIAITAGATARIRDEGQVRLWWDDVPLDLFFAQHRFHDVLQAESTGQPFRDQLIPVVTATHLTVLKALFDRSKDWVDIETMLAAGSVDVAVALGWLAELVGEDSASYQRLRAAAGRGRPAGDELPPNPWKRIGQLRDLDRSAEGGSSELA